jgi:hypothetical protein
MDKQTKGNEENDISWHWNEKNLTWYKNGQHNLALLHSINQSWKQFRPIQSNPPNFKFSRAKHRNTQDKKYFGFGLVEFSQPIMHRVTLSLHQITTWHYES